MSAAAVEQTVESQPKSSEELQEEEEAPSNKPNSGDKIIVVGRSVGLC